MKEQLVAHLPVWHLTSSQAHPAAIKHARSHCLKVLPRQQSQGSPSVQVSIWARFTNVNEGIDIMLSRGEQTKKYVHTRQSCNTLVQQCEHHRPALDMGNHPSTHKHVQRPWRKRNNSATQLLHNVPAADANTAASHFSHFEQVTSGTAIMQYRHDTCRLHCPPKPHARASTPSPRCSNSCVKSRCPSSSATKHVLVVGVSHR